MVKIFTAFFKKKLIRSFFCFFAVLFSAQAQSSFITVLDTTSLAVTAQDMIDFHAYRSDTMHNKKYLITLDTFESYLTGKNLNITLPDTALTVTFEADNAILHPDGSFYWTGISADGSIFRMGKYAEGAIMTMHIRSSDRMYSSSGISSGKHVMVVYDDWTVRENLLGCDNDDEDDDDEDEEDEEIEFRGKCDRSEIRVLVLYTADAVISGNPYATARQLISELNTTTGSSGLKNGAIRFTLAHTALLEGFVEDHSDSKGDIKKLRNHTVAKQLRDDYLADVVILFTRHKAYSDVAGRAYSVKAKEENAYCLAWITAVQDGYTGSHEIGHLIGCRHQRCLFNCCQSADVSPVYAHGYPIGDDYRTIMYANACSRTRVGRWSNPFVQYKGHITGNMNNNNALRLYKRAPKVACFREGAPPNPSPPLRYLFNISGDDFLCAGPNHLPLYTAEYDSTGFPGAQFIWEVSENGITDWYIPTGLTNNGASCILPDPAFLPERFFLRVTVTGSNSHTEFAVMMISQYESPVGDCELMMRGDNTGSGKEDSENKPLSTYITIYPNPTNGVFKVSGLDRDRDCMISVYNSLGREILIKNSKKVVEETIDISAYPKGVYWIRVTNRSKPDQQTLKIIYL